MGGAALGMGALGVAIAAFDHFTNKPGDGADRFTGQVEPPPPPPAAPQTATPPPSPPPAPGSSASSDDAMLLIRAMIAAANADHEVDDDERARILGALEDGELDDEERALLEAELQAPWTPAGIAAAATTPELARQVYLASLLAIEVDTRAEENYLQRLASALGLEAAAVAEVEALVVADP